MSMITDNDDNETQQHKMDEDDNDIEIDSEEDVEGIDSQSLLVQLLMNQQLSSGIPITSRIFENYHSQHYEVSSVGLQGYRDNNEDRHLIHFNLHGNPNLSVFGVFDGHGGDLTSQFVKNTLVEALKGVDILNDDALIACIKQLDMQWIEFENERKRMDEQAKEEQLNQ